MAEFEHGKYLVPPEEVGEPLSQQEMYDYSKERGKNIAMFEGFLLSYAPEAVFQNLKSENILFGAEINTRVVQPDASEIELEFRWPVKSDFLRENLDIKLNQWERIKSYPVVYNSVLLTFSHVAIENSNSNIANLVLVGGEKEELWHFTSNLSAHKLEKAIKKAFLNPKVGDDEPSSENNTPASEG